MTLLWWMFADLPGRRLRRVRARPARDLPLHRDVPRHQRDHPARARQRDPRAAAVDADGQARLPARLRPRLRRCSPPSSRRWRSAVSVGLLGLDVNGPVWLLGVVAVVDAVLGTALGLLVSAFADTEFQAVQFMPAFVIPQLLLCGLFVARDAPAAGARGDQRRAAAVVRRRRHAGAGRRGRPGRASGPTSRSSSASRSRAWRSARRRCGGVRPERRHPPGDAAGSGGPAAPRSGTARPTAAYMRRRTSR